MRLIITCMFVMLAYPLNLFAADRAVDGWFCRDESGKRNGNVLWACGVGESINEGDARRIALNEAFREYHMICAESADCNENKVVVEPKRLTCVEQSYGNAKLWKCYRMIEVTLCDSKSSTCITHGT